jgi:hypothetical protein
MSGFVNLNLLAGHPIHPLSFFSAIGCLILYPSRCLLCINSHAHEIALNAIFLEIIMRLPLVSQATSFKNEEVQ